jgi:hypothetical protein
MRSAPASVAFFFRMFTCASSSAIRRWLASPSSSPDATGQYDPQLGHRTAGMGLLDENSTAVLAAVMAVDMEGMRGMRHAMGEFDCVILR